MGSIHDKIKARSQRLHTTVVPPKLAERGFARDAADLLNTLDEMRANRDPFGSAAHHEKMQIMAGIAKKLGLKGRWNLLCNRTQCLRPDAVYYNRGSYAFYCHRCAVDLNRVNRHDAEELLGAGELLCVRVNSAEEAANLHVMP